jgi:hypothetical protein
MMPKSKTLTLEDKFMAIAEEAISKAEQVKCPFDDFVAGLLDIEGVIRERRVLAEAELEKLQGEL